MEECRRPTVRVTAPLIAMALAIALSGCLQESLVGKPAPAFSIVTSTGEVVNETTYLGRFVVIDLMATWCGPCRLEVAHLQAVQRAYGDDVAILSVGADPTESDAQLDQFAKDYGATWAHGLDRDAKMGRAYGLNIIPKLVIINPEGIVVFAREGEVLPAVIQRVVDPTGAPPETRSASTSFALAVLAIVIGFLAAFNPYRRFHRDGAESATWIALGVFLALSALAWRFAALVSTRATYGSIAIGGMSIVGALWWLRAGKKETSTRGGNVALQAGDRLYEAAPHFALALIIGMTATSATGFVVPLGAFLVGLALGANVRPNLPAPVATRAGLAGLALAGAGLLVFGSRVLG